VATGDDVFGIGTGSRRRHHSTFGKMIKAFQMILRCIPVLACIGCATHPLTSEVAGLPTKAIAGREVSFKVRVHNRSGKTKILPTQYEVLFTTSFDFIAGAPPGELVSKMMSSGKMFSGDYAITRNFVSICPPQFDHLEPGGYREYDFRWKPSSDDRGTGAFRIALPYPFPELPLQPMTIIKKGPNKERLSSPH